LPNLPDPLEYSQEDKAFYGFPSDSSSSEDSLDDGKSYMCRYSSVSSNILNNRQLVLPDNEETLSTIIDVKPVIIQVDSAVFDVVPLFISDAQVDLEEIIDDLQMKIVDSIVDKSSSTSLRLHLHIPQLSFQFRDSESSDYAKLDLTEISYMVKKTRELKSFHFQLQMVMLQLMGKMIWKNASLKPKTDEIAPPDLNFANWPLLEASMCISPQLESNGLPSVDLSLSGTSLVLRMSHSLSKYICVLLDSFSDTKATFEVIRSSWQAVDKPAKEFHLPFSVSLISKFESGIYELYEETD
ncbi:hypothetical protein FF38_12702, partial [Lucilia cuprina]